MYIAVKHTHTARGQLESNEQKNHPLVAIVNQHIPSSSHTILTNFTTGKRRYQLRPCMNYPCQHRTSPIFVVCFYNKGRASYGWRRITS